MPATASTVTETRRPLIIGHRGARGAPENTLAALRLALEQGADGVEVDVRATADGIPVLMHDAAVDHTTDGRGTVASLTLAELKRLDAGGGEQVPTLTEALALVQGSRGRPRGLSLLILVEIKPPGIEEAAVAAIRQAGMAEWVIAGSFLREVVVRVRQLAPEIACALIATEEPRPLLSWAQARGLWGLAMEHSFIDAQAVAEARRLGLTIAAWTVDEPEEARRLRNIGVAAIITNEPGLIRAAL